MGERPTSSRGAGDLRIDRAQLEASPRQHASELLSAAPGFFVDHEDGEGLGNDVTLRGFDLEHGTGIELRLGSVPINSPIHIRGSGYADVDFVIPEVVRELHVSEGVYDPRQGDAAIVGSADFSLGVARRGTRVKLSYGSFNQSRLLAIVAPRGSHQDTFAAVALRKTDGFGARRAGRSASLNAQYGFELPHRYQMRAFVAGNTAESELAGVVREDDVASGRIGAFDSYPHFAENQGVQARRLLAGVELTRRERDGTKLRLLPFISASQLRARQNYAGTLETSQIDPSLAARGDLFETRNRELALGALFSVRTERRLGPKTRVVIEPGLVARAGSARLVKNLLEPATLGVWDRRVDATVTSLDLGAYFDVELTLWNRLRIAGGPRLDYLARTIDDRLTFALFRSGPTPSGTHRAAAGAFVGPRLSGEYWLAPELSLMAAYGEGFRSLDPSRLTEGNTRPYSRVRSLDAGLRARDTNGLLNSSVAVFQTWVDNELVFAPEVGGLDTQNASVRRGLVASLLLRSHVGLLVSTALSVTDAQYRTRVAGVSHVVPNVPPLLWRADASWEHSLGTIAAKPLIGHLSAGYTWAAPAHISDQLRGPGTHALAVGADVRREGVRVGFEIYNLLDRRSADSADRFVSNWGFSPGQQPASMAVHTVAAPPRTLVASLELDL